MIYSDVSTTIHRDRFLCPFHTPPHSPLSLTGDHHRHRMTNRPREWGRPENVTVSGASLLVHSVDESIESAADVGVCLFTAWEAETHKLYGGVKEFATVSLTTQIKQTIRSTGHWISPFKAPQTPRDTEGSATGGGVPVSPSECHLRRRVQGNWWSMSRIH